MCSAEVNSAVSATTNSHTHILTPPPSFYICFFHPLVSKLSLAQTANLLFFFIGRPDAIPIDPQAHDESRKVDSPSNEDHNLWINALKNLHDIQEAQLQESESELGLVSASPQDLKVTVKRLQEANAFDRNLGRIFQASGPYDTYHCTENSSVRLDYGTVELTERRCSGSFPTTNPGFHYTIKQLLAHSSSHYMVFASGRTGGHRYGQLHDTTVILQEYKGDKLAIQTTERAILPWNPPGIAGPRPVPFADPGDSGALVFNHN